MSEFWVGVEVVEVAKEKEEEEEERVCRSDKL